VPTFNPKIINEFESFIKKECSHLEDPLRMHIAKQYLLHEYKRLFATVGDDEHIWNAIEHSIVQIEKSPSIKGYGDSGLIRKFWDLIASVMYFRWHPGFLKLLTSKNILWSEQTITLDDIQLSDVMAQWAAPYWNIFQEATGKKRPTGKDIRLAYKSNPKFLAQSKTNFNFFSTNSGRYDDLIVVQKRKSDYFILDGNRRVTKLIWDNLDKGTTTGAYVCEIKDDPEILDHWVPTFTLTTILDNLDTSDTKYVQKGIVGELRDLTYESKPSRYILRYLLKNYYPHLKNVGHKINKIDW